MAAQQEAKSISNHETAIIEETSHIRGYLIKALCIFKKYPQFQKLVIEDFNNMRFTILRNGEIEATSVEEADLTTEELETHAARIMRWFEDVKNNTEKDWNDTEIARMFRRRQNYKVEKYLNSTFENTEQKKQLLKFLLEHISDQEFIDIRNYLVNFSSSHMIPTRGLPASKEQLSAELTNKIETIMNDKAELNYILQSVLSEESWKQLENFVSGLNSKH